MDNLELLHDRYARALFVAAEDDNDLDRVMREIEQLSEAWLDDAEFRRFMVHRLIDTEEKKRVLTSLVRKKKFSNTMLSFLKVLVDSGRGELIHAVFLCYRDLYEAKKHKIRIYVKSACPLSKEEKYLLSDVLTMEFKEEIHLDLKQRPDLMGGLYLRYRDGIYDDSVKGKIERLGRLLCQE